MTSVTARTFRDVMSRFATGVTVMTTLANTGPHGMTANAVSAVSLNPMLVLACIKRDTSMCQFVAETGAFGLSILAEAQEDLSNRFANPDRPWGTEQFNDIATIVAKTGSPLFRSALAWVDCRVWATYEGGDHLIFVGEVVDLRLGEGGTDALVYFRRTYTRTPAESRR